MHLREFNVYEFIKLTLYILLDALTCILCL